MLVLNLSRAELTHTLNNFPRGFSDMELGFADDPTSTNKERYATVELPTGRQAVIEAVGNSITTIQGTEGLS
ncbi:hypothetical protein MYOV003v1_p0004 [Vibrio phage 207E48.1]|nr:hypothetical protein MYOV003v1_p0004 [Vibrio phage 207E48.1]